MTIPQSARIPDQKVRDYLLVPQAKSDKSKFLGLAGYTRQDFRLLIEHIREQLLPGEAVLQERTEDGFLYRLRGTLTGPNGTKLHVRTVWLVEEGEGPRFITLVPDNTRRL
jgi:hypothetical protein